MTISERMFQIMADKGKMAASLCKILHVNTSQTSSWKNRNSDPPAKYIMQIADFLEVSVEYLLTGEDTSAKLTPLETEVVRLFRQLPAEKQYEFKGELKGYLIATATEQDEAQAAV